MSIIREFRTDRFRVTVEAEPDHDLDLSWDDTGEVARKLDSGELMNFTVHVTVENNRFGVLGESYLGGCIYTHPDEFQDHKAVGRTNREFAAQGERGRCGSYFTDMIREAIDEARRNIENLGRIYVRAA